MTHASLHTGGTPEVITVAEAAALLGVSNETIRNWIEHSQIPYIRLLPGGRATYRIPLQGLLSALGENYDLAKELSGAASANVSDEQLDAVARTALEENAAGD